MLTPLRPVRCFLMPDLTLWEREWFSDLARAIPAVQLGGVQTVRAADRNTLQQHSAETPWIITHDWKSAIRFLAGRRLLRQPTFCSLLGLPTENAFLPFLPWRGAKLPENLNLICHSDLDRRFLTEISQVPGGNVHFVDLKGPRQEGLAKIERSPSEELVVGTLAPFVVEQNLTYLIAVAHYVLSRNSHVRFRIFGEGPLYAHLVKVVDELSLSQRCDIVEVGELSDLASLDIFVHAPLRSHHFIPLNIASELLLPVVSSEVDGISQYVADGQTGFLVPINEIRPMGELVLRLIEDKTLRASLGLAFRKSMSGHGVDQMVSEKMARLFSGGLSSVPGISAAA